jgi:hypothetical protein
MRERRSIRPNLQFWGDQTTNHQEDNQMETQAIEQKINLQRVESIIQLIRSLPIAPA